MAATRTDIEGVFRDSAGRVLAALISRIGDFDLAEDCVQDALVTALERWPVEGVPPNPGGWLAVTARRRAIDRLRRRKVWQGKRERLELLRELEQEPVDPMNPEIPDERLRLIFSCCHPALSLDAQVALTLRTVAGLTTAELSRAFLVPEATLAQRIVRAKRKIRDARIPYSVPSGSELAGRLDGVLGVVYLVFNEGYSSELVTPGSDGALVVQAIRLGRTLVELLPREPEALGLLALMVFHQSRAPGRSGGDASFVPLAEHDRSLWDRALVVEGLRLLQRASREDCPGPYQIQAAISAAHSLSRAPEETDWRAIVELYDSLLSVQPSPVVVLNRAVAVSMLSGPAAAMPLLEDRDLAASLSGYVPYHRTRAELLLKLKRHAAAADSYRRAIEVSTSLEEQARLRTRLEDITGNRDTQEDRCSSPS